jgi:myo-inositol-1(or 4)-monophosphatase
MTPAANNAKLLTVARQAARDAGRRALRMFAEPRSVTQKGPRDVVTDADLAAQKIITDAILAEFPGHGFLAEEEDSGLPSDGPILWLIDPIDGTTNYSRELPIFCVSVAAVRSAPLLTVDDILAGAVYDPLRDEMFTALAGGPALLDDPGLHGRPLQCSSVDNLGEAIVGIDWALQEDLRQQGLEYTHGLAHQISVFRSLGSATLAMAWVAAGRLDAYANFQLRPWDVAAAALLVKQSGGRVADIHGNPLILDRDGLNCLLTNSHLLAVLAQKP